ncbi:MAG: SAM-dependent methyltransferase [Bacteroidales bacterium]|nr:SAM-dependent methyltransferase [Bacteroidales bacterium]
MDTRQFIQEHLHDDVRELALKYSNAKVDMALALRQIEARQLLQKKVPSWSDNEALLFPVHLSIEQCSSEATALYKASLLQGDSFADLTGGLGVDCHFISQNFLHSDYVELNPELCALAEHNFSELRAERNTPPTIYNESAETYLSHCEHKDCLFLDPARRDQHGRKTVSIADCTPNVLEIQEALLQKARRVMVKLSPMLDISKALKELCHVSEVHVVAVANECKELLFIMEPGFEGSPVFICVNLQTEQPPMRFTQEEENKSVSRLASEVQRFLYEPNVALMKGGCYKLLTQRYQVQKLHRNSHLYTSEQLIPDFPGRIFAVEGWAPYNKKIKQTLLAGIEKASIASRNFPLSVAELRKTLKIADGDEVFLFATTVGGEQKVIISARKARKFGK